MKPFNLEEALAGKPVVTRDGRVVTDLAIFNGLRRDEQPLRGVVEGLIKSWEIAGFYYNDGINHCNDLFMAVQKKKVPLTQEDMPPIFWVKRPTWVGWRLVTSITDSGINFGYNDMTWSELMCEGLVYSEGRKTIKQFWKEV